MGKILIVDDEPHFIRVLKLTLERAGHATDTASNGEEALRKVMEEQPVAMITDIKMPKMTGRQLCEAIDRQLPDHEFPIYVTSSLAELANQEWVKDIRNAFFLEKPVSPRHLITLLETAIPSTKRKNEAK